MPEVRELCALAWPVAEFVSRPLNIPEREPKAMSSDAPVPQPRSGMSPGLIIALVAVALMVFLCLASGVLVALLLPAVNAAREAARRSTCVNQLKVIGIAMQNYHDAYKTFPPAYVADAEGKPLHSWRVLILPFMDDPRLKALYDQYDFNEPWNGPNNSNLAAKIGDVYTCPSDPTKGVETNYVAVVGPETAWPGPTGMRIRDIIDGTSNTVQLVEVADAGIHWMEPRDLTFDEATVGTASSHHAGGFNVLFCDGSIHFLENDLSTAVLHDMLTARGGEVVELKQ